MEPYNLVWADYMIDHRLARAPLPRRGPLGPVIYPAIDLVYVGPGEPLPGERDLPVPAAHFEAEVGVEDVVEDDLSWNVLVTDVGVKELNAQVAEALGRDYLSPAVESDVSWPIKGILFGENHRPMVNVVFGRGDRLVNVFCLVDTGSPTTFMSLDTFEAVDVFVSRRAEISIHGEKMTVEVSCGRFEDINLIGADFMRKTGTTLVIDYSMCSVQLVRNHRSPVLEISGFKRTLSFLVNAVSVGWGYVKGLTTPNVAQLAPLPQVE